MGDRLRLIFDGIAAEWCRLTHGGGWVMRDPSGRVNWQCKKCGRWADPVSEADEAAVTNAALARATSPTQSAPEAKP